MNYEVSGRAVGDSGPTAPYTAPRPTKSRRSRVARPRGGSLSSPAQGRHPTDRRHGPEETPHPDWRLSCGIRGHRTRGEDPRNIHPRTRLSLIRTRGSSSASRKRLPHRLPRQGCSATCFLREIGPQLTGTAGRASPQRRLTMTSVIRFRFLSNCIDVP